MEEVEKDDCMKPLEKLFGLTKLTMTKAFLKIDTNGDHIITKEEGEAANKNLDRDEYKDECEKTVTLDDGTKICPYGY